MTSIADRESSIVVPGLGLVERAESLAAEINAVRAALDDVNPWRPAALLRLDQCARLKAALHDRSHAFLGESMGAMRTPTQGGPGAIAVWSFGQSYVATSLVDRQWQQLGNTLEGKRSSAIAAIAIYLSAISIVITTVLGFAAL
jgi:hypothetical protein